MISVSQLTQVYKSGKGIFDVSFDVKEGEVFGYLGPNGAGKTTTIRNLLGFANATSGYARINNKDCRKEAAALQHMIGYLPGEMAFFDSMTGMQFLDFMSKMRQTSDLSLRKQLIDRMAFDVDSKIKKMSKGMKQKLGIIAAFMHDPQVYILDEPTSGLDPYMQNVFMEMVAEEKKRGKTILMSSHIFEEVQRSCDRAAIIREGKLVTIEDVTSMNAMKSHAYIAKVASEEAGQLLLRSDLEVSPVSKLAYKVSANGDLQKLFSELAKIDLLSFESKQESLEDVFMKYYGNERENGGNSHE